MRASMLCGVLVLGAIGCGAPATVDLLRIGFGGGLGAPPIQVDSDCSNGGCAELPALTGQLTYDADIASTAEDYVEILQYRVDYQLAAPNDQVAMPYFAGHLSLMVPVGETLDFNVAAAADRQRDLIRTRLPGQSVSGTATLMLAGYDLKNEQVFPKAEFEIFFGDFVDESTP